MPKAPRVDATTPPAAKLLGTMRRRRAALMVSTALQAAFVLVLAVPPASAQPAPNARPIGGQVVAGSASISQAPNVTTINQSSQRAAVNWQSFNVGAQQTVQFDQPSASAATLNRVTSSNPSQIAGRIDANGQVILVNQDGVTFYKGAQVNASGLVVSAAGISNQNFMAGRMVFDQPAAAGARVVNRGNITVKQAGLAALVAPQVANSGVITAKLGHVVLAGASAATLDLYGDGLVSIEVTKQVEQVPVGPGGKTATALVTNTGTVLADGGTVQLTAQAVDGIVQNLVTAGGRISAASVGSKSGEIAISGLGGSVTVAGQLNAEGIAAGTSGGRIKVVADGGVTLARTAVLNASGRSGGGTVAVGTTLARARGGPSVKAKMTASSVTVDAGAEILADATGNGAGGRVAVLSAGSTQVDGAIQATAGPLGGNGGFVELSGQTLGLTGGIDVSARGGATGTILLDPGTLDIIHSTSSDGSLDGSFSGGTLAYNAGGTTATGTVTDHEIESLGSTGNVVLQATTLLDVQTSLNVANGLTMQSGGDLIVGPGLSIQAGTTLLLGSGIVFPAGTVGGAGAISLGAGDSLIAPSIILQGGSTGIALNNALLSASSSLDISTAGGGVTELNTGTISTPFLTSSNGIVGTASLMAAGNSIDTLGAITVTNGNFYLEDASPLAVYENIVAANGNILLQEGSGSALTLFSGLTAANRGTISLVTDSLTASYYSAITATQGLVEIAPASTTLGVVLGSEADPGLVLGAEQLGIIQTGTLRVGAFTQPSGTIDVTAPSISFGASVDLRSEDIATTLDLEANGPIDQGAEYFLSVGTLTGNTNGAAGSFLMHGAGNDIDALGNVSVADGNFLLNDNAALTVVGAVSAGTPAAPSGANTASISIGTAGTLAIGAAGLPGSLNAGVVALVAQDTINEPNGSIGANTLVAQSTTASVLLTGGMDQISTIAALSAGGSIEIVADPTVLTLTGSQSAATLFFENPSLGGTIALNAATLTAIDVSLVADHLTQPAASTIAATGLVQLAPANATTDVTVGGTADTLGAVLSAITPATGELEIGGFTGVDGFSTITAHSITIAEPLNLGTLAGALELDSNGAVTQGAGDSLLNVGVLTGSAASFALLDGGNQINGVVNLTASGAAGIAVADANALMVSGIVSAPAGQIYLQSANAGGITLTEGTLAGGTLDSIEANAFAIDGGTVLAGPVFELAPLSGGTITLGATISSDLSLNSLAGIGPDELRFGAVTMPGSTMPTTTAGSIVVAAAFGSPAVTMELDSNGTISEAAGLTAGELTGSAAGPAFLTAGNTITTLGSFTADGFTLNDTIPLTVTGAVAGGPSASIVDTGLLTVAGSGSVAASTISLNSGSIEIDGLVSDGGAGTTSLIATGGTINEPGTLISGTLSGSASLSASLTGLNMVDTLGAFTASGFTLDDLAPLTVTGAVTGGPSAVIDVAGQLLTVAGTGSVAADAIALGAGSIEIDGLVSDGGTTSLIATGGTINETGTVLSGVLTGSAPGDILLTNPANMITESAGLTSTNGDVVLVDGQDLILTGTQSGNNLFFEVAVKGGTLTLRDTFDQIGDFGGAVIPATLTAATGGRISLVADNYQVEPNPVTGVIDSTITAPAGTLELAPYPPSMATISTSLLQSSGLLSIVNIGTTVLNELVVGGFTDVPNGATSSTPSAASITIDGTFDLAPLAVTLDLEATGTVSQSAPVINVGTLLGTTGSTTLTNANNTVAVLGDYTASNGFSLSDASSLSIVGSVVAGPSANFTVAGSLTETGSLTTAVLSGSAVGSADLTGNNTVAGLNGFIVSGNAGSFVLSDSGDLLIDGELNATRIVVSDPSSQISLGNSATIVTGGNTRPSSQIPPPSLLPSNGASGAYIQSAGFSQIGSSTLLGQGGGPATLQIASTGNMQFDPSLGLQATDGWLILNLTNGTAAGNVFVDALDVSYTTPGSTNLFGTIRGITGGPAAAAGFIQPAININYLFNGCEIEASVCRPLPPPPPPPPPHVPTTPVTPIRPTVISLPNDAVTATIGGLYLFRFLPGAPQPLNGLTSLDFEALPMLAPPPGQLTDPDVVPPNISYKDY
jgi:filamentous hemagglutinin family protein